MTYENWKAFVFLREVSDDFKSWNYPDKWAVEKISNELICSYLTKLFSEIPQLRSEFSQDQIACGLNYLVSPYVSDIPYAMLDEDVSLIKKIESIAGMYNVFKYFFNEVCSEDTSSINALAKIWWVIFPRHGQYVNSEEKKINNEIFNVIKKTIILENTRCIESALYGLSYWHNQRPEEVEATIDHTNKLLWQLELIELAAKARAGLLI